MFSSSSRWVWWFRLTVRTQYHATSSGWHGIEKLTGTWSANMACYAESSASISRVGWVLLALKHWICRIPLWLPRGQNRISSTSTSFIWYRNISGFLEIQSKRSSYPESRVHGATIGPTWVLSAPDGLHVGPMNFAIRLPSKINYYEHKGQRKRHKLKCFICCTQNYYTDLFDFAPVIYGPVNWKLLLMWY